MLRYVSRRLSGCTHCATADHSLQVEREQNRANRNRCVTRRGRMTASNASQSAMENSINPRTAFMRVIIWFSCILWALSPGANRARQDFHSSVQLWVLALGIR